MAKRTVVVLTGQWVGLPTTNLTLTQQSELATRLQDYLNSDAFLKGIVIPEQMELGLATTWHGSDDAERAVRQLLIEEHPAGEVFAQRLKLTGVKH